MINYIKRLRKDRIDNHTIKYKERQGKMKGKKFAGK